MRRCILCKSNDEILPHPMMYYPFTKAIWEEALKLALGKGKWLGDVVVKCLEIQFKEKIVNEYKEILPHPMMHYPFTKAICEEALKLALGKGKWLGDVAVITQGLFKGWIKQLGKSECFMDVDEVTIRKKRAQN